MKFFLPFLLLALSGSSYYFSSNFSLIHKTKQTDLEHNSVDLSLIKNSEALERRLTGQHIENTPLSDTTKSLLEVLASDKYSVILVVGTDACSACRDQEISLWNQAYKAGFEIPIRVLAVSNQKESRLNESKVQEALSSLDLEIPTSVVFDRAILKGLAIQQSDTPVVLLVDDSGKILNALHPNTVHRYRSQEFVKLCQRM